MAAAGSAWQGVALMLAFGVGTLPTLLAVGAASRWLGALVNNLYLRKGVGVALLLFGVFALIAPIGYHGKNHPASEQMEVASSPGHARLRHDSRCKKNILPGVGFLNAGKESH